jgi:hypothetical protein
MCVLNNRVQMFAASCIARISCPNVARVRPVLLALVLLSFAVHAHGLGAAGFRVITDGSHFAMKSIRVRPTVSSAMLSIYNRISLRGGSAIVSSTSCEHFHPTVDENELHQQAAALGGVDITSIIRRQPSCEELRDYLLPLVGRKPQVNTSE